MIKVDDKTGIKNNANFEEAPDYQEPLNRKVR